MLKDIYEFYSYLIDRQENLKIVIGWLVFHEEEAYKAWNLAVRGEHFDKIPPMI